MKQGSALAKVTGVSVQALVTISKGNKRSRSSVEAAATQVIGDDDVSYSIKDHLDVSCVCSAG